MSNNIELITEKQKAEFNHLAAHPLQSWEWGEFRERQGQVVIRFGEYSKSKLVKVYQLFLHTIPKTRFTVGYLPKSELPSKEAVSFIYQIGRENRAIFIKQEPNERAGEVNIKSIHKSGLITGKPLFTKYSSVIDLTKTDEGLLKSLKQKTRYNIKIAQKHGVIIQEDNSPEAFNEYLKLVLETTKRQGFYAHNEAFHRKQWSILQPAGISHLLTATWEGKTLAVVLLFTFNNKLYYPYGASTREHKELMAPTLLMWEAIRFGKKNKCTSFDLWGDIEPNPLPTNPYFGFHKFKEGFSPELVEFIGTYDLVINPPLYKIYSIVDWMRWKVLRLKAKISK